MSEATREIARFACTAHEPPAAHAGHVARALLDTLGCALAATGTPTEQILRRWHAREAGAGGATVWTSGEPAAPSQAAFLNATAAHILDWDDVSPGGVMHTSIVLLPALLAAAEETPVDGPALVAAHDVGAAVFRAVTQALPRRVHYERGWHTTSTVGRLAAVAALANLRRLDEQATRHALGLAASLAAGSLANFGTMTKPLHAGTAARDAMLSVSLAADGFTANPSQLEAEGGFFAAYGDPAPGDLEALPAELERWRLGWPDDWAIKRYPACYATHRAIDAVLELRDALNTTPDQVDVVVEPGGLRPLLTRMPASPAEARFSMAYALSVALVHGDVRLRHFDEASFGDPTVQALLARVSARESELPPLGPPEYRDGYTVVTLRPGGERRVDVTVGDSRNPLTDDALERKFVDCCEAAGLPENTARDLAAVVRALPCDGDISSLAARLRGRRT
jgi:2-methylcitrate dehydratase PrpD